MGDASWWTVEWQVSLYGCYGGSVAFYLAQRCGQPSVALERGMLGPSGSMPLTFCLKHFPQRS